MMTTRISVIGRTIRNKRNILRPSMSAPASSDFEEKRGSEVKVLDSNISEEVYLMSLVDGCFDEKTGSSLDLEVNVKSLLPPGLLWELPSGLNPLDVVILLWLLL